MERDRALSGVLIKEVQRVSPADRAGLRPGNIIVELDGERVRSAQQCVRLVEQSVPGQAIRAVVVREGRQELRLTPQAGGPMGGPGEPDMDREFSFDPRDWGWRRSWGGPGAGRGRLGASVQALTPQLSGYFGAREDVLGASVQEGSPAARRAPRR